MPWFQKGRTGQDDHRGPPHGRGVQPAAGRDRAPHHHRRNRAAAGPRRRSARREM